MGAIKHPRGEHPFHLQPSVPPPGTGAPRAKKLFQPLHFGLGEEAEQQPLCYAKFPTEAMLGLALCVPSGMPEPPTIISSKDRNLPGTQLLQITSLQPAGAGASFGGARC